MLPEIDVLYEFLQDVVELRKTYGDVFVELHDRRFCSKDGVKVRLGDASMEVEWPWND